MYHWKVSGQKKRKSFRVFSAFIKQKRKKGDENFSFALTEAMRKSSAKV